MTCCIFLDGDVYLLFNDRSFRSLEHLRAFWQFLCKSVLHFLRVINSFSDINALSGSYEGNFHNFLTKIKQLIKIVISRFMDYENDC